MKLKSTAILLGIILVITLVTAIVYQEPWSADVDAGNNSINNVNNITANIFNGGTFIGSFVGDLDSINWTKLKNYPVACPGSGAITQLNDSVTCSDLWVDVAGDTMTGNLTFSNSGILNLSLIESLDWTNVTITESQISDLVHTVNNTNINVLNINASSMDLHGDLDMSTGNLTLMDKITFRFGEIIDNIVDGYIKITGGLIVENSTDTFFVINSSTGFIGIGTSDPIAKLEIRSSSPDFIISESATEYGQVLWHDATNQFRINTYNHNFPVFIEDILWMNDSKVGINTESPTHALNVVGDANITGNITAENVFFPAYLSHHTNDTIAVATGGVFYNITFQEVPTSPVARITHNEADATNDTFTIVDTGIYEVSYFYSFLDSAASPDAHVVGRVLLNNAELIGSLREQDTTKQNSDINVHKYFYTNLTSGDEIKFQFTSDDTTVSLTTHATYGDHFDTALINIRRIA